MCHNNVRFLSMRFLSGWSFALPPFTTGPFFHSQQADQRQGAGGGSHGESEPAEHRAPLHPGPGVTPPLRHICRHVTVLRAGPRLPRVCAVRVHDGGGGGAGVPGHPASAAPLRRRALPRGGLLPRATCASGGLGLRAERAAALGRTPTGLRTAPAGRSASHARRLRFCSDLSGPERRAAGRQPARRACACRPRPGDVDLHGEPAGGAAPLRCARLRQTTAVSDAPQVRCDRRRGAGVWVLQLDPPGGTG